MKNKLPSFWARKQIKVPTNVKFKTKDGRVINFKAKRIIPIRTIKKDSTKKKVIYMFITGIILMASMYFLTPIDNSLLHLFGWAYMVWFGLLGWLRYIDNI